MKKSVTVLVLFLLMSCSFVHNRKSLISNQPFEGKLRTQGYYYNIYNRDSNSGYSGVGSNMKILLSNGLVYKVKNGFGDKCGRNIKLECEIKTSENLLNEYLNKPSNSKKRKSSHLLWNWGKYKIEGDEITVQYYNNYNGDYYLKEERGRVLDSVTFQILFLKNYKTKKEEKVNYLYKFKEYDVNKIYSKIPENL